jgi:glucose-6-phosphate 1-dehydrogenase
MYINNPRWEGVPFIMKAGKALNEAKVEIRVQYKGEQPSSLTLRAVTCYGLKGMLIDSFASSRTDVTGGIFENIARNELVIRIQPSEAIYMKMNAKTPGLVTRAIPTELDLTYKRRFADATIPEAYEALILDAFKGDHSNFVRDDELDAAWKVRLSTLSFFLSLFLSLLFCSHRVISLIMRSLLFRLVQIFTPVLHWIEGKDGEAPKPSPYPYGSRGPKEVDEFSERYGFRRSNQD